MLIHPHYQIRNTQQIIMIHFEHQAIYNQIQQMLLIDTFKIKKQLKHKIKLKNLNLMKNKKIIKTLKQQY